MYFTKVLNVKTNFNNSSYDMHEYFLTLLTTYDLLHTVITITISTF